MAWTQDMGGLGLKPSVSVDLEGSIEKIIEYTSWSEITNHLALLKESMNKPLDPRLLII